MIARLATSRATSCGKLMNAVGRIRWGNTLEVFAVSFELDLVPGSPLSFATTAFVLLLISYILVRGTVAVGDKLTPMIWPTLALFGFAVVAILYSQANDGDVVRFSAETDRLSVEPQSSSDADSEEGGAVQDSFFQTRPEAHDHDHETDHVGFAEHTHP